MNKNVLLVTVAATALIAGASLASAQTMNTEQPKASAPMKPDSEKAGQSAQSPKKDAEKPQTTGQAPKAEDTKKPEDAKKAQGSKPQTTGQAPKAEDAKKPEETKKAPDSKPQTSGQAPKAEDAKKPEDAKKAEDAKKPEDTKQQGQAGQAGGGAQAQISTEQRTQIRQTVMRVGDAPRVSSVNFSLSVGTVVPRTVKYVLLPSRVVEIYPAWRGYHFFIVGDQIVIVEPGSLRIVAVIPA
jgi:cytoskeletal protein RodZ